MTELLKKGSEVALGRGIDGEFSFFLQAAVMREPLLQYPDFTKPFVLTTDPSGFAVRTILSQGKIGQDKPIAFASRN